eukprot:3770855-Pyramimonas_sp.AAC.1
MVASRGKFGSVIGLVTQCVDRCLAVDPWRSVASLFLEVRCLEYPWKAFEIAVSRLLLKHPHLSCVPRALIRAKAKWATTA